MNLLSKYEDIKLTGINSFEVSQFVFTTDSKECGIDIHHYEHLAWSLNFSYKLHEGHHFWARNNYPDMSLLTEECFRYWNERRKTAVNPGIRMRYSELVREFKPQFPNVETDGSFFTDSIELLLETLPGNYIADREISEWYMYLFSIIGKNKTYLPRAKELLLEYVESCPDDCDIDERLQTEIMIINDNWKSFNDQEKQEAADRYAGLLTIYAKDHNDWHFYDALPPILTFCQKCEQKDVIHALIRKSEELFRMNDHKGMRRQSIIKRLQELYGRYQYQKDVQRLFKDIQEASKEAIESMQQISIPCELPTCLIDKMIHQIVPDDTSIQLDSFIIRFIPKKTDVKKQLEADKHSITSLFTTFHYDSAGYPSSVVGSLEKDPMGHYMQELCTTCGMNALWMEMCIERMKKSGVWTCENLSNEIMQCTILSEGTKLFLSKTIVHYFQEEYAEFCYMVIPQIEHIIRHVVQEEDGVVIKEHNEGYQVKTLGELLRDPLIDRVYNIETNDDTVSLYLQFLLANDKGWNLRNRMCHGIEEPTIFEDKRYATHLMHALLFLTNITEKK